MKIILGTESFSPNISGVAVATEIFAGNLTKAGHEVYVFCPGDKRETFRDPKFAEFSVMRLPSIKNPFRKGFRITAASTAEINRQLEKIKPDLIHIQDVASIGTTLRDCGRKRNIPIIITNHFSVEFAMAYVKFKPFVPIARYLLIRYLISFHNKCDVVVTPTETIAKQIRGWGVKTPVIAVSNGIFYHRFQKKISDEKIDNFRIKFHLPENPLVLYAGRIDKDKSIDVIVRSIPKVVTATNAHFVFAGTGDLIAEMEDLADQMGVRKDITFLGRLDHESEDFVALYQSAHVFAIASQIETQSLVTLEAMAAGLPIVAVNWNALPELVKPKINGYLFRPGKSDELAQYLVEIIKNQRASEEMGQNSMQIASEHEMSKAFARIFELYEITIAEKQKQQRVVIPADFIHPKN